MGPNLGVFVLNCFGERNPHRFTICTSDVVVLSSLYYFGICSL